MNGYDIIGDIHGHADLLRRLLEKLDYRLEDGSYRHESRQAIFVGDLIDRGPQIPETLRLARAMVEAGAAQCVLGNHEYNALRWAANLRAHSQKNFWQHQMTLKAFARDPDAWHSYLNWFRTWPVALDLPGLRVVHACWDAAALARLAGCAELNERALSDKKVDRLICAVVKGEDVPLPAGQFHVDAEGIPRPVIRKQWWLDGSYPADAPPVFFGHYWMPAHEKPQPVSHNAACLDYSVALGGPLVAYRWSGEPKVNGENFVRID
jgi:hypothetical protein